MSQVAGIIEISTDPNARICSFKVTDPDLDYAAKLAELATTNSHLAEFTIQ